MYIYIYISALLCQTRLRKCILYIYIYNSPLDTADCDKRVPFRFVLLILFFEFCI